MGSEHGPRPPRDPFGLAGGELSTRSDQPNVITLTGRFVIAAWIVPEKLQTSNVTCPSLTTRCP